MLMGAGGCTRGIRTQVHISYPQVMTHYTVEIPAVPRRLAAQDNAPAPCAKAGEPIRMGGG